MDTKKEVVKALSALAADYSELVSQREQVDELYFSESVPQPTVFRKADGKYFYESDCEKIIDGKYTVNGRIAVDARNDHVCPTHNNCIDLIYDEIKKETITPPVKETPDKPLEPRYEKLYFEHPVLMALSVVTFVLSIVAFVLISVNVVVMPFLGALGLAASIGLSFRSNGGVFALIGWVFRYPKIKTGRRQERERYEQDIEYYESELRTAQIEHDNAMRDYERQVAETDIEYERKCNELYQSVLSAIEEYIVVCKEYFKRKEKTEKENEKQKAIIKAQYEKIVKKIQGYPDIIPPKFLKLPEFDNSSAYALSEIETELNAYIDILESGRADTIKEATNCYIADKQAKEQQRILEEQAEEQRRRAKEQKRILEEQAEEQRRRADEQMEQSMKQTCAMTKCPTCGWQCSGMFRYISDGRGGCSNYCRH